MSWYCKKCETNNEDTDDICLVCNSIPPVWDSVNCKIDSTGTTFRLSWMVNNANKVTILYGGAHFDVSRVYSYDLKISEERQVVFEAENDVATRVFTYTLTESQSLELEKRREQERIAKQKRQDDLAWAATCRWNTKDSYSTYLQNFPNGIHRIEAESRISKLRDEREKSNTEKKAILNKKKNHIIKIFYFIIMLIAIIVPVVVTDVGFDVEWAAIIIFAIIWFSIIIFICN